MTTNLSEQIENCIPSRELKSSAKTDNISKEKENKSSSGSPSLKKISKQIKSIETNETTVPISTYKNLISLIRTLLKIVIPEKFKKYAKFETYYEEDMKKEIIQDIVDKINKLEDKEDQFTSPKNMKNIGLNKDYESKFISMNETIKEMKEMMKVFKERNDEILSQVITLKEETNRITKKLKDNNNNSQKKISPNSSEKDFFKTGFHNIKIRKYKGEFPLINNNMLRSNKYNYNYNPNLKIKYEETSKDKSKNKSKSKSKKRILSGKINLNYINNHRRQDDAKNNDNDKN